MGTLFVVPDFTIDCMGMDILIYPQRLNYIFPVLFFELPLPTSIPLHNESIQTKDDHNILDNSNNSSIGGCR